MLMTSPLRSPRPSLSSLLCRSFGIALIAALGTTAAVAASPANRLSANALTSAGRTALPQTVSGRVAHSTAMGAVSGDTTFSSMSLVLAPTAAQNAALDQLLADQQNPSSASYRKWITPAQFGESFGVSDDDLGVLENWLTSQGFQVVDVSASRNRIVFSGSAANVEAAFHAGLQKLQHNGQTYVSNTAVPTVPTSLSGVIGGVQGLDTYRLQPHSRQRAMTAEELAARANPNLTLTGTNGTVYHELAPYDVRQIYNANSLISSGYTGSGITIGVIGQTAVSTTQIGYFRTLTGQTVVAPTLTLVPNTGTSTTYTGDEGEAESDIEFAGGVAPGATINYIYTGSSSGVFTALEYAITSNIGQILTLSYGGCEQFQGSDLTTMEPYLRQASAQGQTILNSSGDSGAAACDSSSYSTTYDGLAVSYPASSPNVTGVGGTTFSEGTGTYWSTTNNSQNGSALSYIPETTWNDSDSSGIASSGGGTSTIFSKPTWQVGTGVPSDNFRHVPDIAFSASSSHDPYVFCTADSSVTGTSSSGATVTGACTATSGGGYVVGGTSLSTPSFAGLLAIVEQANGGSRLGNINPLLYSLAASNSAVFHDVTSGTNQVSCTAGIPGCSNGVLGYSAGTGYDQVTGLGSVNTATLSTAITAAAAAAAKTPTVTIQETSFTTTSASFVISVSGNDGTTPTGTVSVSVDGGTATSLTLASGAATYTASGLASGTHTLKAVYSGDGTYVTATNTFSFTTSSTAASFTLSVNPTALTVATGGSGTATLTLASTGYTGLVVYSLAPASGSATLPGCFTGANGDYTSSSSSIALDTGVTAGSSVSASIKYHAVTTGCASLSQIVRPANGILTASTTDNETHLPWTAFAFGGFLLGGLGLRRNGRARLLFTGLLAVAFTVAVLGATGCGSGGTPLTTTTTPTTGTTATTYNYVVTATAYPSGSVTGTANLAITVQ